jgi:hypothetical protein
MRRFEERDRQPIREICRQTAREGPNPLYRQDSELAPLLHVDYYMDYEPESCFVAEVNGRVVGYLCGCKNTKRYNEIIRTRILPRVIRRVAWKILTLQYRKKETYFTLWCMLTNRQGEGLQPDLDKYPAHAHSNVEAKYRGQKLGIRFGAVLRQHLKESGVEGLHATIIEEAGQEDWSAHLCRKRGYQLVASRKHALFEKLTGKEWYIKLLVCDLPARDPKDAEVHSSRPTS